LNFKCPNCIQCLAFLCNNGTTHFVQELIMLEDLRRILIIRMSSLGDIILTTPVLRLLRQYCPEAQIEFLVKVEYQDVLREHPCVDRLWLLDTRQPLRHTLRQLRQTRYDLVLDLHRTLRSRVLYRGVLSRRRLAYGKRTLRRALLVHLKWNILRAKIPVPELYAVPLRRLGMTAPLAATEMYVDAESRAAMRQDLAQALAAPTERPLLAVAPGARWPTKRWPVERFAQVAQDLATRHDAGVVILGDAHDELMAAELCRRLSVPVLNRVGQLSLMQTAALLQHAHLLLSNDSGLMHMATALQVPVVAVFGPTVPEFGFYPFQAQAQVLSQPMPCRPCSTKGSNRCPRRHHDCMQRVSSAQVFAAADAMWERAVP
jgi:lipopolysaccharide heptosyltransferase II